MHRTTLFIHHKYTIGFLAVAGPNYSVESSAKLSHMRQFSRQLDDVRYPRDTLCYALHFHQTNFVLLNPGVVNRRRTPIFGLRGEVTTVPQMLTAGPRYPMLSTGRLIPPRRGKLHFFAHSSLEPSLTFYLNHGPPVEKAYQITQPAATGQIGADQELGHRLVASGGNQ